MPREADTPGPQPSISPDGTRVKGTLWQFLSIIGSILGASVLGTATVVGYAQTLAAKVEALAKAHEADVALIRQLADDLRAQSEETRALRSEVIEMRVVLRLRGDLATDHHSPTPNP